MGNNINRNDLHSQICKDLHNLYVTKNSDYGNSVSDTFDKFGIDAFLVRMYDKLNRLYSLTRTDIKQMVSDEKIEDTLLDLANYAILTIIELQCNKVETAEKEQTTETVVINSTSDSLTISPENATKITRPLETYFEE